jgi:hypothetical protein
LCAQKVPVLRQVNFTSEHLAIYCRIENGPPIMPIIGIDLGTSNSAAAVLRGGRPIINPSAEGITLGGPTECEVS